MPTYEDETIAYYDHNADRFRKRSDRRHDEKALEEFTSLLPRRARVLDAGCGAGRDLEQFLNHGFQAEGFDASSALLGLARTRLAAWPVKLWQSDFRFLKLERESYDGIWANRSLIHLSPVLCQRTVQNFFAALKPRGQLFVSFREGALAETLDRTDDESGPARRIFTYPHAEFESMLRQCGFTPLLTGREPERPECVAIIARRI